MPSEWEFIRIEDPMREEMMDEGAVAAAVWRALAHDGHAFEQSY